MSEFTVQERAAAARFLLESGIAGPDNRVDPMSMIGYLASVLHFAMIEFPHNAMIRLAVARCRMFEHAAYMAAAESDPAGLLYSRADEPAPDPVTPPPGVDGTQLGTRAALVRPMFLDGPPLPVCMVDVTTLFCQTHQGVHVAESAEIFDILTAGAQ
ncbi:hypothetical protein [Actinoplanes sp. NPDC049802]|uniref:hypothetical protein n=1 Tax=Actinoplanes sp. NPDC049802 TaxID=3154742 RepID=UPI0033F9DCF3